MEYKETINEFIEYLRQINYAPSTIRDIKKGLIFFGKYLKNKHITDILQIKREDIEDYLHEIDKRNIKPETKGTKIRVLKILFRYLLENRRLFINPVESIPYPKKEKSPPRNILTLNEIQRLIEAPNTGILDGIRDRALLELLYSTGIRQEETVKLNTEDIDTKSGYLFVRQGKGRKDRIIPVGKTAIKWLNEYIKKVRPRFINNRKKDPALFISINGERLGIYWISTALKEYAHQAKIKKQVTPILSDTQWHRISSCTEQK